LRGTTRKGNRWPRQALIEAAQGFMRTKDTYLHAQEERLTRRRGKERAVGGKGLEGRQLPMQAVKERRGDAQAEGV
jgi:hypothetical protein